MLTTTCYPIGHCVENVDISNENFPALLVNGELIFCVKNRYLTVSGKKCEPHYVFGVILAPELNFTVLLTESILNHMLSR